MNQVYGSWHLVFSLISPVCYPYGGLNLNSSGPGNTNVTKVIKAADMVKQDWFVKALAFDKPVDLFLLTGHNIARPSTGGSTFGVVHKAIRAAHPKTPIQIFGGHSHIRDFAVVDESSTALEAGILPILERPSRFADIFRPILRDPGMVLDEWLQ